MPLGRYMQSELRPHDHGRSQLDPNTIEVPLGRYIHGSLPVSGTYNWDMHQGRGPHHWHGATGFNVIRCHLVVTYVIRETGGLVKG